MLVIAQIYRRALNLVTALPLLIALPVVAEAIQHVVEIRLGLYSGNRAAAANAARLGIGIVKIAAIFATMLVAWRWWRFEGDLRRALRPTAAMVRGLGLFLLVQLAGDTAVLAVGRGLIGLAGANDAASRLGLAAVPLLGWLLVSGALFPWYVALITEDRAMTLAAAWHASQRRLFAIWGIVIAGTMPLMAVHYRLGYVALRGGGAIWVWLAIDAGVVGLLAAAMAATYYTLYTEARRVAYP